MDTQRPTTSNLNKKLSLSDAASPPTSPTASKTPPPRSQKISAPSSSSDRRPKSRSKPISNLSPVLEDKSRSPRDSKEATMPSKTQTKNAELTKSHSQYFHATLHERSGDVAGDLVRKEAMVMAELKTNVKIEDEYTFITDLSQNLANRYNRSVDSIIVTLDHSKCMIFGGSMDPAYTMVISALPIEVQKVTNKRNTAVIQKYMQGTLGVPSTRGFLRFVPVSEECVGWGGKTVLGRIGDAGGRTSPETDESRTQDRRMLKSLSLRRSAPTEVTPPTTPSKKDSVRRSTSSSPTPAEQSGTGVQNGKSLRKKKSFMASFFRSTKYESQIPPIPQAAGA